MSKQSSTDLDPQTKRQDRPARIHHVLHVEDNAADAALAEAMLADSGSERFRIETVKRLADAKARLTAEPHPAIDCILLDLGLPDSEHLDTLRSILEVSGDIPIVVLTVQDDEPLGRDAVGAGAEDYLSKLQLVTPDLLQRTVRYAIERSKRERARRRPPTPDMEALDALQGAVLIAGKTVAKPSLRASEPELFSQLVEQYRGLLRPTDVGATAQPIEDAFGPQANRILERLVESEASPADLIDLHSAALHKHIPADPKDAVTASDWSRALALTMMARLAILYRDRD